MSTVHECNTLAKVPFQIIHSRGVERFDLETRSVGRIGVSHLCRERHGQAVTASSGRDERTAPVVLDGEGQHRPDALGPGRQ